MSRNSEHRAQHIAVLAGGDSAEREISLLSGAAVARALQAAGHRTTLLDTAGMNLAEVDWRPFDGCFIALHGGAGEDGRVQQQLESAGVPFTGSDSGASRVAMSKSASKERFFQHGLPTLPYALLHQSEPITEAVVRCAPLGYPLAIKPDSGGSSLGVTRANAMTELGRGLEESFRYDAFAIAEPLVRGPELTVAVLGRLALPALEIVAEEGIFSYAAKYRRQDTQYRFDSDLPDALLRRIERLAVDAAAAIGTRGLARVDFMLDRNREPWILEINSVPGMTERSLAPLAAARVGLSMPALCDLLVRDFHTAEVSR